MEARSFLKCRVEPGMFRDDFLVYLDAIDPKNHSQPAKVQLLVDQRELTKVKGKPKRNSPVEAWLRVTVAGRRGDIVSVVLPQPATSFGESILVPSDHVKKAPGDDSL